VATLKSTNGRRRREAPRKGDLRERAILDAAEALLEKEGLEPVTVEQIARGAGISRAALYFYFGSKQDVLTALVARTMAAIREEAEIAVEEVDVPPKTTIEHVIRRIEKQWLEHTVVMRAAVENGPLIPEVRDLWNGTIERYIDPLTTVLVRAGVPATTGPSGARALAQALAWMGERNFYIASTSDRPKAEIRRASRTVTALWWRAMGVDAAP
jgi:TetR/AcrR family transcriptional regulator, ethionamide resistance regulator